MGGKDAFRPVPLGKRACLTPHRWTWDWPVVLAGNEVAATSAASVAAGQFGALVTQPFDVVKTLVQTDRGVTHPPAFKGPWGSIDAARQLHREAGFGAFWRGLAPRSLRCVLAVFVLGESQTLLDPLYERHLKRN